MAPSGKEVMDVERAMGRKGLSFTMLGGIVLALVGVGILIMMFSESFGSGFQGTFCTVYAGLGTLIPGDSPPPQGCGEGDQVSYDAIRCPEADSCVLDFASEISNCWQQYQGYMTEAEMCQGWNVEELNGGPITESDVESRMQANDICPNQISCNSPDQVRFDGDVQQGDFVVIEYQSNANTGEEWIQVR